MPVMLGRPEKKVKGKVSDVEEMVEMPMYRGKSVEIPVYKGEITADMFYNTLNTCFDDFLQVYEARKDKDTILPKLEDIDEEFTENCFVD